MFFYSRTTVHSLIVTCRQAHPMGEQVNISTPITSCKPQHSRLQALMPKQLAPCKKGSLRDGQGNLRSSRAPLRSSSWSITRPRFMRIPDNRNLSATPPTDVAWIQFLMEHSRPQRLTSCKHTRHGNTVATLARLSLHCTCLKLQGKTTCPCWAAV